MAMLNIKKILFPTDFSRCAERAFSHAAYLADRHEAELHVLHVVETPTAPGSLFMDLTVTDEDIAEQTADPSLAGQITETYTDVRIVNAQRHSASIPAAILRYAEQEDLDLIVMGTHGRRGIDRLFSGSVAEEVVRRATCPVFTVCARHRSESLEAMRRILVPIDFSEHSEAALRYAGELATTYGADLDLLHVIEEMAMPGVYGIVATPLDTGAVQARVREALAEQASDTGAPGRARTEVVVGHTAAVVLDYAEEHGVDLIVIATHGRTGLKRFLMGSVAEKVAREAPCPVFIVKSFGRSLLPQNHAAAVVEVDKEISF